MKKESLKTLVYTLAVVFLVYDLFVNSQTVIEITRMFAYGVVINLISESIVNMKKSKRKK